MIGILLLVGAAARDFRSGEQAIFLRNGDLTVARIVDFGSDQRVFEFES